MDKVYKCPRCKKDLAPSHQHKWFYRCAYCKRDYPLYLLEPHEAKRIDAQAHG